MIANKNSNDFNTWKYGFLALLLIVSCLFQVLVAGGQVVSPTIKESRLAGGWTAHIEDDRLFMALENKAIPHDSITTYFSLDEVAGLAVGKQGIFSITRDAGTITFEGMINKDQGKGTYRFIPNALFVEMMGEEGFEVTEGEQVNFFLTNITKSYIKQLKKHGYGEVKKTELLKLAEQGLGKKAGTKKEGEPIPPPVDADPLSQLVNLKSVGITEAFIKSFEEAGYTNIPPGMMINFKSVGVTPSFIKSFEQAGLKAPTYSEIINFKLVGVTPAYIKSFHEAGYSDVSYSTIVNLKAAGVVPPKK